MLQKTRGVNSWNAFVKARLKDENEGQCNNLICEVTLVLTNLSLGLGRGDRTKLTAFIAENKATLLRDYRKLTFAEKQAYNACVLEDRQEKNRTARSNPKAVKHDVNAAFTSMDREVRRSILRPLWHLSSIRLPSWLLSSIRLSLSLLLCPLRHLSSIRLPSMASLVYSFALVASLVYSFALVASLVYLFAPVTSLVPSAASLVYSFALCLLICLRRLWHLFIYLFTVRDTTTNTTEIYPQWMGLHARTGLEGFYVAVRGGIEDLAEPKIFFTEKSQKFVRDVLGIEPQHLGLKLEAFVISKLGMLSLSSSCSLLIVSKMNM
jgi:hypothetical protein